MEPSRKRGVARQRELRHRDQLVSRDLDQRCSGVAPIDAATAILVDSEQVKIIPQPQLGPGQSVEHCVDRVGQPSGVFGMFQAEPELARAVGDDPIGTRGTGDAQRKR